jgi:hypothetical protein
MVAGTNGSLGRRRSNGRRTTGSQKEQCQAGMLAIVVFYSIVLLIS